MIDIKLNNEVGSNMVYLEDETLDWALKHCRYHSLNLLPIAFEYESLKTNWDEIKTYISSQNLKTWRTRPLRKFFVPRDTVGYRIITELDPIDHLIYASLIYEIGEDIENKRSPKECNEVFSYRFQPNFNGSMYDPDYPYTKFLDYSQEMAESEIYRYVASTDISDFYLNIYEHRLENNLKLCTTKEGHVEALINLLKQWNEKVSRGIPIGPMASRLLAESILIDVDELLKIEGIEYCRWNDDFRIFADSYEKAYAYLYKLSSILFRNHNLTLQKSKTDILPIEEFKSKYIFPKEREQILSIREEFEDSMLSDSGIVLDGFGDIIEGYSEEGIDEYEISVLVDLVYKEANNWEPNFKLLRFVINRLLLLKEFDPLDTLIENLDTLYPIIFEIMRYLLHSNLDDDQKAIISEKLLKAYNMPIIQTIDYARLWILHYFALNPSLITSRELIKLYGQENDDLKREITYIMGEKEKFSWVRTKKGEWQALSPWLQRAYLKSTNCLPADEKKAYHNSIKRRLDLLSKCMISK